MPDKTIIVQGTIEALGDIDYEGGGTVRGVLIKLHADDVRKIGAAGLLYRDVVVEFENRNPGTWP